MNVTAIRQRPQWIVIGTVVVAAVVGGTLRIMFAQPPQQSVTTEPDKVETAVEPETTVELFQSPMLSLSAELRKATTPSELVRSTTSEDRLSVVTTGRLDPFAPITQTISATSSPQTNASNVASGGASNPVVSSLPSTSISQTPDLPPVPTVSIAPPPLPSIPIAINPLPIPSLPSNFPSAAPPPQSPIQAVELTGVVQVGDRVGVIIREGNGQSSRHIFEGDLLAGGQIRVKSIDLSSQEPLVIFEYQGKEYTRMVG